MAYTPEQKSQAKALAVYYGGAEKAVTVLEASIWGEGVQIPAWRTIHGWTRDPRIAIDDEFLQKVAAEINVRALGWVERLIDPVGEATLKAALHVKAHPKDAGAMLSAVKGFTFLTNLVRPANASGGGTQVVIQHNTQFKDAHFTFAPKDPKEIEATIDAGNNGMRHQATG